MKILRSLELDQHMLEKLPQQLIADGRVNVAYKNYKKQDDILGCWLISCIIEEVLKKSMALIQLEILRWDNHMYQDQYLE